MKKENTVKKNIWIIAVLLIFTVVFFLFGHYKAYLYEDEVLSYTAANSQDGMRPSLPVNEIVNGGEFVKNAVAVRPDRRFDFANAIANTSTDPHPPVYLLMLHFVSSLFPGLFSKWFALAINYVFGAVTALLLYLLGSRVLKDKNGGIVTSAIYVLTVGFITQLMNLRMYVVLQAFTTWLTLQYIMTIKDQEEDPDPSKNTFTLKRIILFIINIVLGTMTHYYFLIFAFFEAAIFSIMMLTKKRYRDLIKHTLMYVVSGVLSLIVFPPILWQLTGSDVGSESFNARNLPELIRRFRVMLGHLNNEVFGGQLKFYVLCFVIWLIYMKVKEAGSDKQDEKPAGIKEFFASLKGGFLMIFLTTVFYFLTVSVTTPYLTGRYLSPVYPLCILLTVGLFREMIRGIFKSEAFGYFVLFIIMAVPLYLQISAGLYDVNKAAMQEISKEHANDICVFFRGISTEENYFELENYNRLMAMRLTPNEGDEEKDSLLLAREKSVVVYIPSDKEPEEYFNRIREINPKLKSTERLYRAYYSDAYIMKE